LYRAPILSYRGIAYADTTASAPQAVASAPLVSAHPLNKDDLEAFFDGIIPLQLQRSDVAGASVLVMKDGETLLLKGYGYSDLKSKQPVDPTSTIFRLASISKLFTWISAMQLAEQGKLDLDVDERSPHIRTTVWDSAVTSSKESAANPLSDMSQNISSRRSA
jgi:CubicO group peptidase (beta-lactamase class C family)